MVASAVISYATSYKLPLSTTYVTFMVAMGASFADRAWGRESAVYRVTGVLTVIGGWFVTAISAFTVSFMFATVIFFGNAYGVVGLLGIIGLVIRQSHFRHKQRTKHSEKEGIFNLKKITSVSEALPTTFEHVAYFLSELRESLDISIEALFAQNEYVLSAQRTESKKIQRYANIIIANVFKTMRLLQRKDAQLTYRYGRTVRRLQKLADGHRDIVLRAHVHVSNQHKGLLDVQVEEISQVQRLLDEILIDVESTFNRQQTADFSSVVEKDLRLRELVQELQQVQMERVRDGASKTRLSILFYATLGNAAMISKQCLKLLETFSESFGSVETSRTVDPE
jgi:Na+/phosphate symporter